MPHQIDTAVVGKATAQAGIVSSVQRVVDEQPHPRRLPVSPGGLYAIDLQRVYAALDLTRSRRTLCVASADVASVARLLEQS
jgi:hypothetical protein